MPLKLELFSRETTCILATVISTVSVCVAVTSLPALLAIKGSARNLQDVRLTGRSPIQAGHARNRPILITGRSIGASLILFFINIFVIYIYLNYNFNACNIYINIYIFFFLQYKVSVQKIAQTRM